MATPGNTRPHDRTGRFIRSIDTVERDAEACRLRANGHTYQHIAEQLGYSNKGDAHHAVQRALKATVAEPAEDVRRMELARLDAELERLNALEQAARTVLERDHITVSHGRIIKDDTGTPIPDTAPILAAIDRLVRIEDARRRNGERRAKLLGLDAPTKVDATVTEITQQDIELQEMIAEIKARNANTEKVIRTQHEAGGG